jgi:outer membrane cobalamin receptor
MKNKLLPFIILSNIFLSTMFEAAYSQTADSLSILNQDSLSLKDLLNVKVTTASKTSQSLEMAPATAIVITQEQIRMRGYQSLLDVMYDLPDIKIDDKIYSGMRNNFTIRGTPGQEKFLILLDGVRITSPSGEAMPIMENYPVNFADQIEIIYGPASALYGADAVSGVINIISKKIPSWKSTTAEFSSTAGSYGYTNSSLFLSQKLNDHLRMVISGQYFYDEQPDLSKTNKENSETNVDDYSTGTLHTIYGPATPKKSVSPSFEAPIHAYNIYAALQADDFAFSYFRNFTQTPSAWGSNTSNGLYNKDAFIAQGVDVVNASYKKVLRKFSTTTTLNASQYTLSPKSNYRNLYTGVEPAYKYASTSVVKGEEQLEYKISTRLNVVSGAGYELYYSIPYSTDLDGPVDQNEYIHQSYLGTNAYYSPGGLPAQFYFLKYHNANAYMQLQYAPAKSINFTLGGRYDNNSRYGKSYNPRLGMVYKPFSKTTIKLLYGTAFLAPSPSDCYAYWGSFVTEDSGKTFHSYFLHLPNPDLHPITSKNTELSIQQYVGDNFSVTLNGYYTRLTNLHGFNDDNASTQLYHNSFNGIPVDYVEVYVNQSRQINYGGSVLLNLKNSIGRIKLNSYVSLSYVDGKIQNGLTESDEASKDLELDFIAPFMVHAGTDMKVGKFSFSPRLILLSKQHINGFSDTSSAIIKRQTIGGYALLNLSLRFTVMKGMTLFSNITNALNQQYKSVGFNMDLTKNNDLFHGQPEDPIRIMAGVTINTDFFSSIKLLGHERHY